MTGGCYHMRTNARVFIHDPESAGQPRGPLGRGSDFRRRPFSVDPRDGEECDGCNSNGGNSPYQKVRVVTSVDYEIG